MYKYNISNIISAAEINGIDARVIDLTDLPRLIVDKIAAIAHCCIRISLL